MKLVDVDVLLSELEDQKSDMLGYSDFNYGIECAIRLVESITPADAVPVVHGRWEVCKTNGFLYCSECKDVFIDADWLQDGKWSYCPNCGAKMDGGN